MTKKKNSSNDGVIPSVGKNFAKPNNSTNTGTSDYSYTNKEILQRQNPNSFK
ncbi:hypothetical protein [Clostridium gasigenes]|uniref:hypothetical protein n=1 Tax=Clostridium gasigenes TaxID=94869 RepID=UPI001C0CC44E|nr:hypothetical protein [Clostridium gasigenes]MBU3107680.1 hypothetical protein [Clostridium gasigenes]